MASFAALISVAAEGTTSVLGGEDATIVFAAGATVLEEGAGADIVCRRKGKLSNQFYAEIAEAVTAGTTGACVGTKRISF